MTVSRIQCSSSEDAFVSPEGQRRCTRCSGFRNSPAQHLGGSQQLFFSVCIIQGLGWPQLCWALLVLTYWIPGAQSVLGWAGVAGFPTGAEWWLDLNPWAWSVIPTLFRAGACHGVAIKSSATRIMREVTWEWASHGSLVSNHPCPLGEQESSKEMTVKRNYP